MLHRPRRFRRTDPASRAQLLVDTVGQLLDAWAHRIGERAGAAEVEIHGSAAAGVVHGDPDAGLVAHDHVATIVAAGVAGAHRVEVRARQRVVDRGQLGRRGVAGGLRGLHVGLAGECHLAVGVHGHAVSGAVAEAGAAFEGDAAFRHGLGAAGSGTYRAGAKPQHRTAEQAAQQQIAG